VLCIAANKQIDAFASCDIYLYAPILPTAVDDHDKLLLPLWMISGSQYKITQYFFVASIDYSDELHPEFG